MDFLVYALASGWLIALTMIVIINQLLYRMFKGWDALFLKVAVVNVIGGGLCCLTFASRFHLFAALGLGEDAALEWSLSIMCIVSAMFWAAFDTLITWLAFKRQQRRIRLLKVFW